MFFVSAPQYFSIEPIFGITKMEAALFLLEKESLHLCRLTSILHSHATYQFNDVGKFRLNDL